MDCIVCGKSLSGGIDTFGAIGAEMCWACWSELGDDAIEGDSWYGLAPHKHNFDDNGNIIIGSTTFDPLPPKEADGSYVVGGYRFTPDPEAPGLGIWSRR